MENKALFLDFDGVLFNTIKEVYLVNRAQYKGIDVLSPIDSDEYKLYSKYKFLVYNIWMFTYYNPLIFDCKEESKIIERFKISLENRNRIEEEKFYADFLNIRYDLIKNHFDFWKNLEEPYDFFFFIKELYENKKENIIVVSKKNKSSIIERFESYEFNFDKDKIFADEILSKYSSKGEFIEEYMKEHNISSAIFVDDNINNLLSTENKTNIKNILALWGNTPPNSKGYNEKEAEEEIKNYFISR